MDPSTPITVVAATYESRDAALDDYHAARSLQPTDGSGHLAIAVLGRGRDGHLRVELHDRTTRNLIWGAALLGAVLVLVAPSAGARFLASVVAVLGAGSVTGQLRATIPVPRIEALARLLESRPFGLVLVTVNAPAGEACRFEHAAGNDVARTTWGALDAAIEQEVADAQVNPSGA